MSKLYTEDQMIQAYESGRGLTHEEVLEQFVPIQLPTDEELEKIAKEKHIGLSYRRCFLQGAKWMRNKIQGGQDE